MKKIIFISTLATIILFLASYCNMKPEGPVDTSFDTIGPNNTVWCMAVQKDQKIVIGGWFTSVGGTKQNFVARLNKDGSVDKSFNTGEGGGTINGVMVQPDGKIIVAGWISMFNNVPAHGIVRLNSDGSIDKEFNLEGAQDYVMNIALQKDGKIIIVKAKEKDNSGLPYMGVARLDQSGKPDPTFTVTVGEDIYIKDIKIQEDGKILVGGNFSSFKGQSCNGLVRLNTDGSLDATFNSSHKNAVSCIDIDAQQRIIVGEYRSALASLSRLLPDGSLDDSFDQLYSYGEIDVIKALPNGNILVGGTFAGGSIMRREASSLLVQLKNDGSYLNSLHDTIIDNNPVRCLAIDEDGNIIAGGSFKQYNRQPYDYLVKLYYKEEEEK